MAKEKVIKKLDTPIMKEQAELVELIIRNNIPASRIEYNLQGGSGKIMEYSTKYVKESIDLLSYSITQGGIPLLTIKDMARILAKIHSIKQEDVDKKISTKLKQDYEHSIFGILSFFEGVFPDKVSMIKSLMQKGERRVCLLDFSPQNILVDQKNGKIKCIVDFDTITIGDPLYDLMSSLCFLNEEDRKIFLKEYSRATGKTIDLHSFFGAYFTMYLLSKVYFVSNKFHIPKKEILTHIEGIMKRVNINNIIKEKENMFGLKSDFLSTKLKGQIRHVSITVTNFCNNNCDYCTRPLFNESEFDANEFEKLIKWLSKSGIKKVTIFGGEPTLHSRFNELMGCLKDNGIICTLLSNGRFGSMGFFKYIGNPIRQITIHLPTLKDKNRDDWGREATKNILNLQDYMKKNKIEIPIGLGNVVDHEDWDWRLLLKLSNKFNIDFTGFCMAHPTDIHRKNNYASFEIRKAMMNRVFSAFRAYEKYGKRMALDFFMPCLIEDNIESLLSKKQETIRKIFQKSYSPQRMYELNFMSDGSVEIGTCLFKENRLVVPNILKFESLGMLEDHIEGRLHEAAKGKKWPKKCLNCKFFNDVCKGDHLNLISEWENKKK